MSEKGCKRILNHKSFVCICSDIHPHQLISAFPAQTHTNLSERHTFHSLALTAMQWPSLFDVVISFQRHCKEPGGENLSQALSLSMHVALCFLTYKVLPHSIVLPSTHTKDDTLQNGSSFCDYLVQMNTVSHKYSGVQQCESTENALCFGKINAINICKCKIRIFKYILHIIYKY